MAVGGIRPSQREQRWQRIAASAGMLFVALFLVAFGLDIKDFPEAGSASAKEIEAFIEEQRVRIGLSTASYALAWAAFLWFIGRLRSALSRAEPEQLLATVAFGGGLLTAGLFLAGTALQSEIIFADLATNDEVTLLAQWALFDASGGFFAMTPLFKAVFVGAAALAILRRGGLPRWLGWAGLLAAIANFVGGFDYLAPPGRSFTGHPLVDLFAFLVWVSLASGVLAFGATVP